MDIQLIGQRLIERGFKDFFLFLFKKVEGKDFIVEAIHEDLFKSIEYIHNQEVLRLIVNICPRSAKTTLLTYFIAYAFAINPKCEFIYTGYSQELLSSISLRLRDILEHHIYKNMFVIDTKYQEQKEVYQDDFWIEYYKNESKAKGNSASCYTSKKIITASGGVVLFVSIGSQILGNGCGIRGAKEFSGCLIIDDPNNSTNIRSKILRNKTLRYFEETLLTRLNDSNVAIAIVQQRLHVEDLTGLILNKYKNYIVLKKPLFVNDVCQLPSQYSKERIEEIKINTNLFNAQYMQEPTQIGGNLIKTEWFSRFNEEPERFDSLFITCDTAQSTKTSADNSAFGLFGIKDGKLYLLDLFAGRLDFPNLKSTLKSFYLKAKQKYKYNTISTIYIEAKSSGLSLIQELKQEQLPIQAIFPTVSEKDKEVQKDKYWRAQEVLSDIAEGYVHIPSIAPWLTDFINEVESFTGLGDSHDDRVDVLLYALKIRRKYKIIDWEASYQAMQQYRR